MKQLRKINTRQLHKKFFKEIDDLPFIIMKNQKPYAYVVAYEDVEEIAERNESRNSDLFRKMQADAIKDGRVAELTYKGVPIVQDDPPTNGVLHIPEDAGRPLSWYGVKPEVSFMQRLKLLLTKKVF